MEGDHIKINKWLLPLSWLYGLIVGIRNELFELKILKTRRFNIPVISIGNITVGGSGKTPHVEYLIRLLMDKMNVAVLSRGYKRKSHGYALATTDTPMQDIGDEPYQMKTKYPKVHVAVDKNRCEGISRLTTDKETCDTDVILLDDAFQHRYVQPGINILLVDYHRLIIYDRLLPAGRLREPLSGKHRADIVIITKCPKDLNPIDYRVLSKAMDLYPFLTDIRGWNILLLTGIATPQHLKEDLNEYTGNNALTTLSYPDHHAFTKKDIRLINETFERMSTPKIIITTEKDKARLTGIEGLSAEIKENIYSLPIKVRFMLDKEKTFNDKIISYVRKNSRNSILAKKEDDNKSKNRHHSGNRSRTISFRDN